MRLLSDEAFRGFVEGAIEGKLAGGVDGIGLTLVHLIGGHQADAGMVMLLIVPIEEAAAEGLGVLDGAEAFWELRLVYLDSAGRRKKACRCRGKRFSSGA